MTSITLHDIVTTRTKVNHHKADVGMKEFFVLRIYSQDGTDISIHFPSLQSLRSFTRSIDNATSYIT